MTSGQSRRGQSTRHSPEDRVTILDRFEARYATGLPMDEAAEGLGASLASIKRWRQGRSPLKGRIIPTLAQMSSIDAAIARLADDTNRNRNSFLEALFKLVSWLRWPTKPHDHPAAIMVCVVTYLHHKNNVDNIEQLDRADRELLLRHVRLDTLRRVCSDDLFSLPSFLQWKHDGQPHTDLDWIALVVWFLLAYEPRTERARDAVSLAKAYFATQNDVFPHTWPLSLRTFKSYWSLYGAAAPFHYVERFHLGAEFTLDPGTAHFGESVNDLINQPGEIRQYLARARWAVEMLTKRLDLRTLSAIRFPAFPASLTPERIDIPALPSGSAKVMKTYSSR
ncbi:hypothetical protein [Methylobacterium trifolii]|uniref:XRE family transcriptional regulator n=1 Tax=Methylobacterium trifolii TaxID=1003092 RepID=A0ABQ4U373_9HYPH|nr:hypothetical protein [Methylobacterium trifolii]GJE61607.1 hypothetical protein MPOCJGCO_3729 [Methylobacterium trifolii]